MRNARDMGNENIALFDGIRHAEANVKHVDYMAGGKTSDEIYILLKCLLHTYFWLKFRNPAATTFGIK